MSIKKYIPQKSFESELPTDSGQARLIERPDGFYWQDSLTDRMYGPFATLSKAIEDMQYQEDSDYEEGESLQEAESEIGIADWIDPETGGIAENSMPHLGDD
jgi:hypothetical protein